MNIIFRSAAAASLAVFAAAAVSYGPSSAGSRTACQVLTGPQASGVLGTAVTARLTPTAIPTMSVCMYMAGGRPIVQLGLQVMQTEAVATQVFRLAQQGSSAHKNTANRQKGNTVLSAITMNGDSSKLNGLLDAAAKNL